MHEHFVILEHIFFHGDHLPSNHKFYRFRRVDWYKFIDVYLGTVVPTYSGR